MTSPETTPSIRPACPDDRSALVSFNAAMAEETEGRSLDAERLARGVGHLLDHPDEGFYLVAELGGVIAGQIMVTREWSDWRDGAFWWIQSVYVVPEHRRRGVYRRLHEEVARRAREAGACGLRLYVERENRIAQETYRRLGMERTRYELFEVEL